MLALEWEAAPCPLCGSRDEEELLRAPTLDLAACRVARCRPCGMLYSNPRVNERTVGLHYPDDYESYEGPEDGRQAKVPGPLHRLVQTHFWGHPPTSSGWLGETLAWLARPRVR